MRSFSAVAIAVLLSLSASAQTFQRISVTATGGKSMTNWHGQASLQTVNVEFAHTLSPRYEVSFVMAPTVIDQPRSWFGNAYGDGNEKVRAISGSLLGRRTWKESSDRASYYVELSSGPMWAEKRVPAGTSRFNFHSQAGAGVIFGPQSRTSVIIGYRFGHISNGGYAPRNPGLNVSSVVVGVRTSMTRRR
jgi:hypothetical protein